MRVHRFSVYLGLQGEALSFKLRCLFFGTFFSNGIVGEPDRAGFWKGKLRCGLKVGELRARGLQVHVHLNRLGLAGLGVYLDPKEPTF